MCMPVELLATSKATETSDHVSSKCSLHPEDSPRVITTSMLVYVLSRKSRISTDVALGTEVGGARAKYVRF